MCGRGEEDDSGIKERMGTWWGSGMSGGGVEGWGWAWGPGGETAVVANPERRRRVE